MRNSIALSMLLAAVTLGQTGGSYDLKHSVIAGGGGSSAAGSYSVTGTIGQAAAGTKSTGGQYSVTGGFLVEQALTPTAAGVRVSGRVLTSATRPIRGALVTLMSTDGTLRRSYTNTFGYFRFENVRVGEICILQAVDRRHTFVNSVQVLNVQDEVAGISIIADP